MVTTGVGCDNNNILIARAKVMIGGLVVETPFIQSISVKRQRGNPVSQASFSLSVDQDQVSQTTVGDTVFITFYGKAVFTGLVKSLSVEPSAFCAGKFFLNAQCEDPLYKLNEGRRIVRRQKQEGLGPLAMISSKVDAPERGFDTAPRFGGKADHSFFGDNDGFQTPAEDTNPRGRKGLSRLINPLSSSTIGENHPITKAGRRLTDTQGNVSGGGFIIHDHTSIAEGGPAHAVYGVK